MNKKDVLAIIEEIASDAFFKDYAIRKCDNTLILKSPSGYRLVHFNYYNTFDLERGDLALEIMPAYDIRFNILHKWFEKYSKRNISDQRSDWSIAIVGEDFGRRSKYYFLENRVDYEKDLHTLKAEVVRNAEYFFSKFSTLNDYYEYYVGGLLSNSYLPYGFYWAINYLIATKVVRPSDYDLVKKAVLDRLEYFHSLGEPNLELYYDDLPAILEDLEQTDFQSGKWG